MRKFLHRRGGLHLFAALLLLSPTTESESSQAQGDESTVRLHVQQPCFRHLPPYALSPDGRWIAIGCSGGPRVWELDGGREIRRFPTTETVKSVAFTRDSRRLLVGSFEKTARLWDIETGREIREFTGIQNEVTAVVASPNQQWVVTASGRHTRLYDLETGQILRQFDGHSSYVNAAAFSADGRWLLTASSDNSARLWDVADGRELRRFDDGDSLNFVAMSADNRYLLTGGYGKTGRLWEATSGREIRSFDSPSCVALSSDGRLVLAGGPQDDVRLYETETGREVRRFKIGSGENVEWVSFSPDGNSFIAGDAWGTHRVWNAASGSPISGHDELDSEKTTTMEQVVVSQDSRLLLGMERQSGAQLWDLSRGQRLRRWNLTDSALFAVALARDGRTAALGGFPTRTWNLASGESRDLGIPEVVTRVVFSPDGRWLATTQGERDKVAHLWEIATGREIRRLEGHTAAIAAIAFSPDSQLVVTGGMDETARVWNAVTGQELRRFETGSAVDVLAISPDGHLLATSRRDKPATLYDAMVGASRHGGVVLWDLATGKEVQRISGHGGSIEALTFSPDGSSLLTGSQDQTARLWDVKTGKETRRFSSQGGWVTSVGFTPDGRTALTVTRESVIFWDTDAGREVATIVFLANEGWAVVDPEGRYDASDPDRSPGLHWVLSLRSIDLGQLKQRFYTPGLLARALRRERLPAVTGLNKLRPPPDVSVEAPAEGSTVARLQLANLGGGIGRLVIKVNNREISLQRRGPAIDPNAMRVETQLDLAAATLIGGGVNVIEVFAETSDGLLRSRGVAASWLTAPPSKSPDVRLFAIVAGVSEYRQPRAQPALCRERCDRHGSGGGGGRTGSVQGRCASVHAGEWRSNGTDEGKLSHDVRSHFARRSTVRCPLRVPRRSRSCFTRGRRPIPLPHARGTQRRHGSRCRFAPGALDQQR